MFVRLIHSNWSVSPAERWAATAERQDDRWLVGKPLPKVKPLDLLDEAFKHGEHERVLLGFDFPIGLPEAYGKQTSFANFKDALPILGTDRPDGVSFWRTFCPQRSSRGVTRTTLWSRS